MRRFPAALCLFMVTGCARGPAAPVLKPEAAEPLQRAFERMRPSLSYDSIEIDRDHAVARLCSRPEACFRVALTHPGGACGEVAGAFCVSFLDDAPAAAHATIHAALEPLAPGDVWSDPRPGRTAALTTWLRDRIASVRSRDLQPLWTVAVSVLLLLGPLLAGAFAGRLVGRRFGGASALLACAAVPAAVSAGGDILWPMVGLWDALLCGLLFGAGVAWRAHRAFPVRRAAVALSAVVLCAGLAALEGVSRAFLPAAPSFGQPGHPHLLLRDALRTDLASAGEDAVCSVAYGDAYPTFVSLPPERSILRDTVPRPGATARVLHLGDSMVAGQGIPPDQTFVAQLERMEPGTEQVRNGWGGKGPDTYLVVLRDWLRRQSFTRVVLYLFEGNDLEDLDASFPCAQDQSLLVYEDGRARLRYATPQISQLRGWRWMLLNSPAPYVVRALLGHSAAAAQIAAALYHTPRRDADESEETRFAHLAAILKSARDDLAARHIPLTVVVLPDREVIEGRKPPGLAARMAATAAKLGLPVLDATAPIQEAVARGEHVFLDSPAHERPDCHFNATGHAIVARWLREKLGSG